MDKEAAKECRIAEMLICNGKIGRRSRKMNQVFSKIRSEISPDIGFDLGATTTRMYVREQGVILEMPSVIEVEKESRRVVAVGGREVAAPTSEVEVIHPFEGDIAANVDAAAELIRFCVDPVLPRQTWRRSFKPRAVIAVPSGFSDEENHVVERIAERAGLGDVSLINSVLAAAIGVGLPFVEPKGCMIVNVGSAWCEAAVISSAGIVHSGYARCGGADLDAAIVDYLRRAYGLSVNASEGERVKRMIGTAQPMGPKMRVGVRGHDVETGREKDMMVASEEVQRVLAPVVSVFVDTVRKVLAQCDSGLLADIGELGIVLSGGGSQLLGLGELLEREVGLPIAYAFEPESAIINGVGFLVDGIDRIA